MARAVSTPAGHQGFWPAAAARTFQSLISRTSISKTTIAARSAPAMKICSRLWAA